MVNSSPFFAFFDGLGGLEMMVIFVLSLMLFGGKRLPDLAKGLGKSIREFKRAASGVEDEIRRAMDLDSSPHRRPPPRRPRPASKPFNPEETPAPEALPAAKIVESATDASDDDLYDYHDDHAHHDDHHEDYDHDADHASEPTTDPDVKKPDSPEA